MFSGLSSVLSKHPIVYITRDMERACGIPLDTPGYFIISNSSPLAKSLAVSSPSIMLVDEDEPSSTRELISREEVISHIAKLGNPSIVVFKNNSEIEKQCKKNGWELLNPPAIVAATAEEKISQIEWLGELKSLFPPHRIVAAKDISWEGRPFILQFNHSHTGMGTLFIDSEDALLEVQKQFPNRPTRCADFIQGPIFTNNNVVMPGETLVGNINYQITGLAPFTDNPFATIGNDWALPHRLLSKEQKTAYCEMVEKIGARFREEGWKGLFGIDVIMDEKTGKLYLLEINARQPASTTFESELQRAARDRGASGITTFEAHLAALLDIDIGTETLIPIADGAQIFQRVTRYRKKLDEAWYSHIDRDHIVFIEIGNTQIGKEIFVARSSKGFMADHNIFGDHAKTLL